MSDNESFLTRWGRLKGKPVSVSEDSPPVDLSNLPPVESLTADSDFKVFLQPGVPPNLMRQALQRAWRTDPAILDFVGIAEMQWDFNDPTAMPGFGDLDPLEREQVVVQLSQLVPLTSAAAAPEAPLNLNPGRDGLLDRVWAAGATQARAHNTDPAPPEPSLDVSEKVEASSPRRHHGSALPKPL